MEIDDVSLTMFVRDNIRAAIYHPRIAMLVWTKAWMAGLRLP